MIGSMLCKWSINPTSMKYSINRRTFFVRIIEEQNANWTQQFNDAKRNFYQENQNYENLYYSSQSYLEEVMFQLQSTKSSIAERELQTGKMMEMQKTSVELYEACQSSLQATNENLLQCLNSTTKACTSSEEDSKAISKLISAVSKNMGDAMEMPRELEGEPLEQANAIIQQGQIFVKGNKHVVDSRHYQGYDSFNRIKENLREIQESIARLEGAKQGFSLRRLQEETATLKSLLQKAAQTNLEVFTQVMKSEKEEHQKRQQQKSKSRASYSGGSENLGNLGSAPENVPPIDASQIKLGKTKVDMGGRRGTVIHKNGKNTDLYWLRFEDGITQSVKLRAFWPYILRDLPKEEKRNQIVWGKTKVKFGNSEGVVMFFKEEDEMYGVKFTDGSLHSVKEDVLFKYLVASEKSNQVDGQEGKVKKSKTDEEDPAQVKGKGGRMLTPGTKVRVGGEQAVVVEKLEKEDLYRVKMPDGAILKVRFKDTTSNPEKVEEAVSNSSATELNFSAPSNSFPTKLNYSAPSDSSATELGAATTQE